MKWVSTQSRSDWTKHRKARINSENSKVKKITMAKSSLCKLRLGFLKDSLLLDGNIHCTLLWTFDICWCLRGENSSKEIINILWQNICNYSKMARICHLLCKRPGYYLSASKTHVRDRILYWQFMLQWFIRFPEFAEFNERFAPFRNFNLQCSLYNGSHMRLH